MPRANSNKGNGNGSGSAPEFIKLESYEVTRAKEFSKNGKSWHNADVKINGVMIYGCRAVTYTDRDGKEKDFLAFPERKGSDGNYYKYAYAALSPADQQKICDAIWAKLDGK